MNEARSTLPSPRSAPPASPLPTRRRTQRLLQIVGVMMTLMLAISAGAVLQHTLKAHADSTYHTTWLGTSSNMPGAAGGPDNQEQFVQDYIDTAVVQPDGTIWTSSGWDEAGHAFGEYRNGQVVGSGEDLGNNNHNLNKDSARSVTDGNGVTWQIQNSNFLGGDSVCRTDNTSVCITGSNGFRPNAVAMANDGTLMVADNGPDQQIKFYDVSSGNPSSTPVRTFGEQGGVWAGPTPGLTGPLRFSGLNGTGMDSSGNIYVIGTFPGGGVWMRSLQQNGTMNWQLYGKIFVGNAVADMATDAHDVYDHNALYKMDYSQTTPGTEVIGDFPYAVTVDPWAHPDDPRLYRGTDPYGQYSFSNVPKWLRNCFGHKYMFITGMYGGGVTTYVQQGLMWVNINLTNGPSNWPWAEYVDDHCDFWQADTDGSGTTTITHYPATGADSSGNLTYGSTSTGHVGGFNESTRVQYDTASDTLYVSGFTPDRPRVSGWGDVGTVFQRYSSGSSASPSNDLTINFPYNFVKNSDGSDNYDATRAMQDWEVNGNYLFGVYGSANYNNNQRGSPGIWSLSDGSYIADLTPTPPIPQNSTGWVDVKGLTTAHRSNDEYDLFIEDDWRNKVLIYRWCPSGNCPENGGGVTATPSPTPNPTSTPQANLPSPWQTQDIGSVGSSGSASYSSGTFTVTGSGTDIWGTSDAFRSVYQSLSGDGTIVAHVASQQNTNGWAKAGVMIRSSLDAGSPHAFMALTPGNGAAFQYRASSGGDSSNTNTGTWKAPSWVKLVRSGNTFTGSVSSNGSSWTQIGSTTISIGSSAYIGLAVTSHSNGTLSTATFDNVSVTTGSGSTPTPTPTSTPTSGSLVVAINAGGSASGNFVADTDVDQGNQYADTSSSIDTSGVSNPAPQAVYQTCRWNSAFTYTIPNLTAGASYKVRLHWAELSFQASGSRTFNVAINGASVLSNFDVYATAGYKKALVKEFTVSANSSGQIVIAFTQGGADNPFVNGIEVYTA